MLPSALFTTFRQYKEDTQTITEWLATTARVCGYQPPMMSDEPGQEVKPKSKSKNKNKKKKKTATASVSPEAATVSQSQIVVASTTSKEYVVKTNEYVPMARAVAESVSNKVIIPLSILRTWKSCIVGRGATAKWYESNADVSERDGNVTHEYFIEVLKRALQVLVPVAKLQELDRNQFKLSKDKVTPVPLSMELDNKFAHLEVQDIDEATYEALADASLAAGGTLSSTEKKPQYVPEGPNPFDEWYFALQCFMEDMEMLQKQAKGYWEEYANGESDLVTTAVSTNTAIEMVKKAEEEFLKLKRPDVIEAWGKVDLPMAWFGHCLARDEIDMRSALETGKYFVPMHAWEQAKESYLLIQRLCVVYSNGTVPGVEGRDRVFAITRPAYFGTYNPELEFEDLSDKKQYEQMAACLNDMLVTIGGLVMMAETPCDDMLMQGIHYLQQNEVNPPMWLLFACQNFLDIQFTLQTRSERPFEELRDFAIATRRTLKQHQAFMHENRMPRMRNQDDEDAVDEILEELECWVLNDEFKKIMSSFQQIGPTKKRRVWQDFEILRMSPLLCGTMRYTFHIQLQWKGITLVNDTGLVAAAHLYNALQANGYFGKQSVVWEDMEYLLELHRSEDTFMGERPSSIEDCTKRLALVQGVAPTTFARRRRGNNHRVLRSRNGSKFLKPSTPITQILGVRYLTPHAGFDWHLEQLESIVGFSFESEIKSMQKSDAKLKEKIDDIDLSTQEERKKLLYIADLPSVIGEEFCKKHDISVIQVRAGTVIRALRRSAFNYDWKDEAIQMLKEIRKEDKKQTALSHSENGASSNGRTYLDTDDESDASTQDSDDWPREEVSVGEAWNEVYGRWKHSKTLPLDMFIDIVHDSLQKEYLDIQFDYFAFFRSTFSLMQDIQMELKPLLEPILHDGRIKEVLSDPEGAVCVVPQMTLLVACNPLLAPNITPLRDWLGVDTRPLRAAGNVMKAWIEENGDRYCITEQEREDMRTENMLKEGPKVRYFDSDDDGETPVVRRAEDRKAGWSSSLGLVDGLNAREMREVFDAMKDEDPFGATVAETISRLKGTELDDEDRALAESNQVARGLLAEKLRRKPGDISDPSDGDDSVD